MSLSAIQFVNLKGAPGPAQQLVDYSPATALAFLDNQWGCLGEMAKVWRLTDP